MANAPQKQVARTANGQFGPGVSGNAAGNVHRSRHALNADTIREMHAAFRRGGRKAIEKVMRNQPAVFLKLLGPSRPPCPRPASQGARPVLGPVTAACCQYPNSPNL